MFHPGAGNALQRFTEAQEGARDSLLQQPAHLVPLTKPMIRLQRESSCEVLLLPTPLVEGQSARVGPQFWPTCCRLFCVGQVISFDQQYPPPRAVPVVKPRDHTDEKHLVKCKVLPKWAGSCGGKCTGGQTALGSKPPTVPLV